MTSPMAQAGQADVDEGGSKSQFEGFKLAMTDIKTYVFALAYMCITGDRPDQPQWQDVAGQLCASLGTKVSMSPGSRGERSKLLSGAFGNLIAAGILNGLRGHRGLSAWQWLYIIFNNIEPLPC
jgi:hypothetical protein